MSLTYGIAAAVLLLVVLIVARLALRRDPRDHVERFHQARSMTTKWAEQWAEEHEGPRATYLPPEDASAADDQGPTVRQGRERRSVT